MSYHCRLISPSLSSKTSLAILTFQIFLVAYLSPAQAGLLSSNSPFRFRFNGNGLGGLSTFKRENAPQVDANAMELQKLPYKPSSHMLKRDYEALQCRGLYDLSIFTKLKRICDDCFNLYHDAEIHELCRSECFSSFAFRSCLQSLLMEEESDFYLELVDIVGKKR